ncbi:hypothetical protein ACFLXT_03050 [Chloroflexota bacterium]
MEGVIYAAIGFAGVLIGSVFSYLGIIMNLTQQNKIDSRQWSRKVRGEPLFKLRDELAVMSTKLEKLAKQGKSFTPIKTGEQEKENLEQSLSDYDDYVKGDHLEKVLYSQSDIEIINRVREIRNDYLDIYSTTVTFKELSAREF